MTIHSERSDTDLAVSDCTVSFTASSWVSANAIKTSIATSTSVASYTGGGLDGTLGGTALAIARTVSVTTVAHAATYNTTDPIVITGVDSNGTTITESLQPTIAGGGQTIVGTKAFAQVTKIDVPAQLTALGAFTFGVRDLAFGQPPRMIRTNSTGNLKLGYRNGTTDTIPGCIPAEQLNVAPIMIYGDGNTTVTSFTIFF